MRVRLPVTQEQAAALAVNLGDAVRMDLGGVAMDWWIVRSIEAQPGTEWLHVVLEETEEP